MSWLFWLAVLFIPVVVSTLVVVLVCDRVLRAYVLDASTNVAPIIFGERSDVLIITEPGVLADGLTTCAPIRRTLCKFGDVLQVGYAGATFDSRRYAQSVANLINARIDDYLNNYDKIIIVGTSLGGLTALDLRPLIKHEHVSLVAVDTPLSSEDLKPPNKQLARLMTILPAGPIINTLIGPIFRKTLVPPKDDNIEPGLDKELVKREALQALCRWPLSINRDQLLYIHTRGYTKEDFEGFERIVYIECNSDKNETVEQPQPQARNRFVEVGGVRPDGTTAVSVVAMNTTHAGYAESPTESNRAFQEALDVVLS